MNKFPTDWRADHHLPGAMVPEACAAQLRDEAHQEAADLAEAYWKDWLRETARP